MILLIVFLAVGVLFLGAVFCITLIGGLPWSNRSEGAPIQVGNRRLSMGQLSLGLMLMTWGVVWLMAWLYLVTEYDGVIFNRLDARAIHYAMQLPLSFIFLGAGVAVLREWRRWRGAYLTCVALLGLSVFSALTIEPTPDPTKQLFRYILPMAALVAIGGIRLFLYIVGRVVHLTESKPFRRGGVGLK